MRERNDEAPFILSCFVLLAPVAEAVHAHAKAVTRPLGVQNQHLGAKGARRQRAREERGRGRSGGRGWESAEPGTRKQIQELALIDAELEGVGEGHGGGGGRGGAVSVDLPAGMGRRMEWAEEAEARPEPGAGAEGQRGSGQSTPLNGRWVRPSATWRVKLKGRGL